MELPIQIMVVLFVTIVAGALLLAFSQSTILQGEEMISRLSIEPDQPYMISLNSSSTNFASNIVQLTKRCYEQSLNIIREDPLCFIVRLDGTATLNDGEINNLWESEFTDPVPELTVETSTASAYFIFFNSDATMSIER